MSEDTAANLSAGHVIIALNQDGNQDRMYAAYEFIKFMTSHDANLAVAAGNTGYLPIRQSVAEDPAYEAYVADGHEYMRAGVEQSDRYFYEPVFTNATTTSSAVNSAVKTMMQEVADNGIGIPDGDRERIFERFYRVDKARSRESGGTGLGLSIAQEIIRQHEGSLSLVERSGPGTTLRMELKREGPKG